MNKRMDKRVWMKSENLNRYLDLGKIMIAMAILPVDKKEFVECKVYNRKNK